MTVLANTHISGHSLIEVLAALVIINLALLGFLHSQQQDARHQYNLLARVAATSALDNMAAYIAMNPRATSSYLTEYGTPPPQARACHKNVCTEHELAIYQLSRWKCRFETWFDRNICDSVSPLHRATPNRDGKVRQNGQDLEIEIRWGDARETYYSLYRVGRFE